MSPQLTWLSPAWTAAGWTMLHLVWIGCAIGPVVALLRRALRPAHPEIRHGVAVACLLALSGAPVVLFAWLYRGDPETGPVIAQAGRIMQPDGPTVHGETALPDLGPTRRDLEPLAAGPRASIAARFEPVVGYLPGVWLGGSIATLALLATGLIGVERLRWSSRPIETSAIAERCRTLADSLGVARRVGVAICDRIAAPVFIGIVRPIILLPTVALGGWTIEQVEMALLHELAHIRRHDNLVMLLQRLAESLLFFHPLSWWLSAWVNLERELCCDRLVVQHTGRPEAYARMLAALAGARSGTQSLALAMAERPLTTRIRRILDMEDRSMKMTLTEGLGLLAAVIAGTTLAIAAHARAPEPVSADADRQALERLVERVVALPDGEEEDGKGRALLEIAQAQLKLGDRAAALATLRVLDRLAEPQPSKPGAKVNPCAWARLAVLTESAVVRSDAGDRDGARSALARSAERYLELLDHGTIRGMLDRVAQQMDATLAAGKTSFPVDDEDEIVGETPSDLIEKCITLGDKAIARTLIGRMVEAVGPPEGVTKAGIIGRLGIDLLKAGDPARGRALIERSRQATLALSDPEARALALRTLAGTLSAAGDFDQALALLREMTPPMQQAALGWILESISAEVRRNLELGGIEIWIEYPILSPKDPAVARVALPKIAAAARALRNPRMEAIELAMIAPLQANSGDLAGALATARSIPDLKRPNVAGPSDGYHEAAKPITFAVIAAVQARAGDQSAAVATLAEAEALARNLEDEGEKLIAQIVIAQKSAACGRRDVANPIITEAVRLARTQAEPRRSRVLNMLARVQMQAGDAAGAARTVEAIRDEPGLEKAEALWDLAEWHEKAGDQSTASTLLRRAVACLEAKASAKPLPGKLMAQGDVGHGTFTQFNLEMDPELLALQRGGMLQDIRTWLGDVEGAVRAARSLPPEQRDTALSEVAGRLARRGDIARAMEMATSIESPDGRMLAFVALAEAISERQATK